MSSKPSPLPNRVTPFGEIVAVSARGSMMGNRGGKIHDGWRIVRKQASRRWIICVCEFKGRQRKVMESGYTELFFLDEATAMAAGHRPCFECRRASAKAYAAALGIPRADDIDLAVAKDRLKPAPISLSERLPDGAMIAVSDAAYLVLGGAYHRWSFDGYGAPERLSGDARLLTPRASVSALAAGYRPVLHSSAC
ncbi:MAG: hypothetical protein AAF401_14010 [Pseudomonadota bacterium]